MTWVLLRSGVLVSAVGTSDLSALKVSCCKGFVGSLSIAKAWQDGAEPQRGE